MKEFDLLAHVYDANVSLPASVSIPPGDDMGAVRTLAGQTLVTVDQIADGVHFLLDQTPLEKIARKAVTRNLSDVAAMGASPVGAVVAACLPRSFGEDRARTLFDAMRQAADFYHCPLFGGDIAMWEGKLLISVTVLAQMAPGVAPVLRSGAQAGDILCVTGSLGGSLEDVAGVVHHLDFEPRLAVGQLLAGDEAMRPTSMLDLSDGLSRDVRHLCHAAGLGTRIDLSKLPISAGAKQASARDGKPAWLHALADGEDYELCFTIAPEKQAIIEHGLAGVDITAIGQMTAEPDIVSWDAQGQVRPLDALGWEHQGS